MADHTTVDITQSQASCGILELSRIDTDTEKVLYAIASRLYHPSRGNPAAFVMWSDICEGTNKSNGELLANYLTENFACQAIDTTDPSENPKTGNIITVWMWTITHEELKDWYIKKRTEKVTNNKI